MAQLEQQILAAKKLYAETLQNLEKISDEIHTHRRQEQRRKKKARKLAKAAGSEPVIYHPLMNVVSSSSDDDSGNETSGDADSAETALSPPLGVVAVKNVSVRQIDCIPNTSGQSPAASSVPVGPMKPPSIEGAAPLNSVTAEVDNYTAAESAELPSSINCASSVAESTSSPMSPESDVEQMQANAAVMAAISRSKLQRVANPFLRPDSCREDLSVNGGSETESVSGSFVSVGGVGALDDEQIESLMVDDTEYQRIVANMDAAESDRYHQMALPARLRHLQDFMNFEPVWIDDGDDEAEVFGATQNSPAGHRGTETRFVDDRVFAGSENVENGNPQPESGCRQSAEIVLDKNEHLLTSEASALWHPLMNGEDDVSSTSLSGC